MLSLGLKPGEYLKIGDNIIIQCKDTTNALCYLTFNAPREIPIVRGKALEADGEKRPDCVFDAPKPSRSQMMWNQSKAQSLAKIRRTLDEMAESPEKQILQRNLNNIFPTK